MTLGSPHVNGEGQVVSSLALAPTNGVVLKSVGTPRLPLPRLPPPTPPAAVEINLTGSKIRRIGADLYWSGLRAGTPVDVFRNGTRVAPAFTYSSYPDRFGRQVRGKYTWQVCLAGTRTCSNTLLAHVLAARPRLATC